MADFHRRGEVRFMKTTLIAVASFFLLAVPAHAQTRGPGQLNYSGGGGGGVGLGGGGGATGFRLPVIGRQEHDEYIYVQGSEDTFVPTRFVSFDAAVKLGKEALAYRPKTIVEVAAECRAAKKRASRD
jgi:hypothetical protein